MMRKYHNIYRVRCQIYNNTWVVIYLVRCRIYNRHNHHWFVTVLRQIQISKLVCDRFHTVKQVTVYLPNQIHHSKKKIAAICSTKIKFYQMCKLVTSVRQNDDPPKSHPPHLIILLKFNVLTF